MVVQLTHGRQCGIALDEDVVATTGPLATGRLAQIEHAHRTVLSARQERRGFVGQREDLVGRVIVAIEHVQVIWIRRSGCQIRVQHDAIARARHDALVIGLGQELGAENVRPVPSDLLDEFLSRERIRNGDRLIIGSAQN